MGGRVRTDVVYGFRLDRGFQVLQTSYPEARCCLDVAALRPGRFEPGAPIRFRGRFHCFVDRSRFKALFSSSPIPKSRVPVFRDSPPGARKTALPLWSTSGRRAPADSRIESSSFIGSEFLPTTLIPRSSAIHVLIAAIKQTGWGPISLFSEKKYPRLNWVLQLRPKRTLQVVDSKKGREKPGAGRGRGLLRIGVRPQRVTSARTAPTPALAMKFGLCQEQVPVPGPARSGRNLCSPRSNLVPEPLSRRYCDSSKSGFWIVLREIPVRFRSIWRQELRTPPHRWFA